MVSKEVAQVGMWGSKARGSIRNEWSFKLEKDHKLKIITIGYDDCVSSLMFTSEDSMGRLHTSNKFGGWNHESPSLPIALEPDEKIISINGTVGDSTRASRSYKVISSLSFATTKRRYGPYGQETETRFYVPWDAGSFAGFYGLAGHSVFSIGVYLKASPFIRDQFGNPVREIARVGLWGKPKGNPKHLWSFVLTNNYKMNKIYITHTDEFIFKIKFLAESNGHFRSSDTFGGPWKGSTESQVTFDGSEELVSIEGTFQDLTGSCAGYTIASSLTFITTKNTHGPYGNPNGQLKGTFFSVQWKTGSFAGFYGIADCSLFGIGVLLKATI